MVREKFIAALEDWDISSSERFRTDYLEKYLALKCPPQHRRPILPQGKVEKRDLSVDFNGNKIAFSKRLMAELSNQSQGIPQPFALSIDASGLLISGLSSQFYGGHTVLLIGRRWNSQKDQCELLVRNTWDKNSNLLQVGQVVDDHTLWAPADRLLNSATDYEYMTK